MKDPNPSSSIGSGCVVAFIVFLVLKLCGVIDWSWWWVTCPLWGPVVLIGAFLVMVIVGYLRDS